MSPGFSVVFYPILCILADNEDMHKILDEFKFLPDRTTDYGVSCPCGLKNSHRLIMGKWCLHASSFIFDRIIIKVAGNQDRHKSFSSVSGLWFPWPIYMFFVSDHCPLGYLFMLYHLMDSDRGVEN